VKNLAGDPRATEAIAHELRRVGVEAFVDPEYRHPEVKTTTRGRLKTSLGEFVFSRYWYYWVVHGPTPLAVALALDEHPVGRSDIRVAGHCGCPPPATPWVTWRLPSGQEVADMANFEEATRFAKGEGVMKGHGQAVLDKFAFSDDPAGLGAAGFVDSYHIDSELGLYLFVQAVKGVAPPS
jgi:hypothetical protein